MFSRLAACRNETLATATNIKDDEAPHGSLLSLNSLNLSNKRLTCICEAHMLILRTQDAESKPVSFDRDSTGWPQ